MLSEDVTDIKIAKKRAEWEANYRRTHARQYFITVQGFNPIDDDILWHTNYLIRVIDDFSDVNELLLINGIEYIFSLDQGSITNLNLISKDAYSLIKEEAQPAKIKNLFTGFIQ
jgi:prophage tail gpP-like protein